VLLGLTNAQKFGLAGVAFVFVAFSLLSSMLIPRYRPDFPGRRHLRLFVAATIVLFIAMLGAVEVFAREEEEEPREEAAAETTPPTSPEPTPPPAPESPPPPPAGEPAPPPPPAAAQETTLENPADPSQLRFSKETLEAAAGAITLVMENPSPLEHNIAVRGEGVDEQGEVVGQGEESRVTVELEAGEYEFYCSVPGHDEAGMNGTLTVSG
jgi:plastocyanin